MAHCGGRRLLCAPNLSPLWARVPHQLCLWLYQNLQRHFGGWGESPRDLLRRRLAATVHFFLECHVHYLPFRPACSPSGLQCWLQKRYCSKCLCLTENQLDMDAIFSHSETKSSLACHVWIKIKTNTKKTDKTEGYNGIKSRTKPRWNQV